MKQIPIYALFVFLCLNCANDQPSENNYSNELELKIIDSTIIEIDRELRNITSYSDGVYSFYKYPDKDIFLIDKRGKQVGLIDNAGDGPGQYNQIRGVSLLRDKKLIIIGLNKYYIYNFDAEVDSYHSFPNNYISMPNIPNFNQVLGYNDQNELLLFFLLMGDMEASKGKALWELDMVVMYNAKTSKMKGGVRMDKALYSKNVYPANSWPLIDFYNGDLYVVFPYEKKLQKYKLPSFEQISEINIEPSFFSKLETIKQKAGNSEAFFDLAYINSQYTQINAISEDYIMLSYKVPCQLEDYHRARSKGEMPKSCWKDYIQIFKNGAKLGNDIIIPEKYRLESIFDLDHIILFEKRPKKEENKFFRAKINLELLESNR